MPDEFSYTFRRHSIVLSRETEDANWYIKVRAPDGLHVYDGWWRDSAGKTLKEALAEAKHGAQLRPYGVKTTAPPVTDDMALAFHRATTDGAIGSDDLETIKAGLRAVFDAYGVPPAAQCWCLTCRPLGPERMEMVVCPECGCKRCPHAENHAAACTGYIGADEHGGHTCSGCVENRERLDAAIKGASGVKTPDGGHQ